MNFRKAWFSEAPAAVSRRASLRHIFARVRIDRAATVTSKGQVTIPKRVRDQLGLKAGSKVEFVLVKGHAVFEPVGHRGADALAGSLRAYSKALAGRTHREIMEEVR